MDQFLQLREAIEKEHWAEWQYLFPQHNNPQEQQDSHFLTVQAFNHLNDYSESAHSQDLSTSIGDKLKPYKLLRLPQKNKCIYNPQEELSEKESLFEVGCGRQGSNKKKGKGKREGYPTKNFLQTFRTSFLSYLRKHFNGTEQEFKDIEIVSRIKGKKCINLDDYQDLFNQAIFRPILENYFREKVIMRDLMMSRVEEKRKRHYFKRVHVFEEAFVSRKFKKINY